MKANNSDGVWNRHCRTSRVLHAVLFALSVAGVFPLMAQQVDMTLVRIVSGLERPVYAASPPGDTERLFIIEQKTGNIKIFNVVTGDLRAQPFIQIGDLTTTGNEQGLLGLAFHPGYEVNGRFFVNVVDVSGDTHIREYTRLTSDTGDPASKRTIITIGQPFSNHNGGWLGFGPHDGFLYIATGDGGSGNDPNNNAQDTIDNLLGKILRIDIDGDDFNDDPDRNYRVPADNPFVGASGDDEIWAYGLRNPWRVSFDRLTGDLYIADVGQLTKEELNVQPGASTGGENYGWRLREGTIANPSSVGGPRPAGALDPVYEYDRGSGDLEGFSVTGGFVYRGPLTALQGHYFFADFVNSRLWSLRWDRNPPHTANGTNVKDFIDWTEIVSTDSGAVDTIASFGEDAVGNLYLLDFGGEVFRVDAATTPVSAGAVDLVGISFDASPDRVRFGDVTVTFTVANQGAADAGQFDVDIIWSDDATIGNGDDVTLASRTVPGLLANDTISHNMSVDFDLAVLFDRALRDDAPGLPSGSMSTSADCLGIVIDPTNRIPESDELNNTGQGMGLDADDITYFPWDANPIDRIVTPTDAIYVINRLMQFSPPADPVADIDGDGAVTPTDAITVINRLGRQINDSVIEESASE